MKYKPTPLFCAAVIIISFAAVCAYFIFVVYTYQSAVSNMKYVPTVGNYGPDISHCFEPDETRELWDCIRHKEENNE